MCKGRHSFIFYNKLQQVLSKNHAFLWLVPSAHLWAQTEEPCLALLDIPAPLSSGQMERFFFFLVESPLRLFDMRRIYLFSLPCSWLLCTCVEKTVVIHTWVKGTNVYLTLYRTKISGFYCHIKQPQALFWAQHRISFRHNCHKWMDHLLNKWVHLTCLLSIHPSYRSQEPYFEIFCLQSVSGYVYNLSNI